MPHVGGTLADVAAGVVELLARAALHHVAGAGEREADVAGAVRVEVGVARRGEGGSAALPGGGESRSDLENIGARYVIKFMGASLLFALVAVVVTVGYLHHGRGSHGAT